MTRLTTFEGRNFIGDRVLADVDFIPQLEKINQFASHRGVEIHVTSSARSPKSKLTDPIVPPAEKSNHFVGHAIDMNIQFNNRLYKSNDLALENEDNLPIQIQQFIQDIRDDNELRWGGDFQDPVHIDDNLYHRFPNTWNGKYPIIQSELSCSTQLLQEDNFINLSSLDLNGSARVFGDKIELTDDSINKSGSAFQPSSFTLTPDTSFKTSFQFQLSENGADGFSFIIHDDLSGTNALGDIGSGLGYGGIDNSFVIEFDTFRNTWDSSGSREPNDNHIAINFDGDQINHLILEELSIDLNSGKLLTAWIDYDAREDILEVFVNNHSCKPEIPNLIWDISIEPNPSRIPTSPPSRTQAYVGFTASTGGSSQEHIIQNWSFEYVEGSLINLEKTIEGTNRDDRLVGGFGDDIIDGGLGQDKYIGGKGADIFIINPNQGLDTVRDFHLWQGDKIALGGGMTFEDISISRFGKDGARISLHGEDLAIIQADRFGAVNESAFISI